jgi:hypothetical protein
MRATAGCGRDAEGRAGIDQGNGVPGGGGAMANCALATAGRQDASTQRANPSCHRPLPMSSFAPLSNQYARLLRLVQRPLFGFCLSLVFATDDRFQKTLAQFGKLAGRGGRGILRRLGSGRFDESSRLAFGAMHWRTFRAGRSAGYLSRPSEGWGPANSFVAVRDTTRSTRRTGDRRRTRVTVVTANRLAVGRQFARLANFSQLAGVARKCESGLLPAT